MGYSKRNLRKKWDEVYRVYNVCIKTSEFSQFSKTLSLFLIFLKLYFNQKTHRLRIKTSSYRLRFEKISDKFICTIYENFTWKREFRPSLSNI